MASIKDLLQGLSGYFTGSTQGLLYQREQARQNVEAQARALMNQLNVERTMDQLATSEQARRLAAESHIAQGLNMTPQQRADFDLRNQLASNEALFQQKTGQEDIIRQRMLAGIPLAQEAMRGPGGTYQLLPYGGVVGLPNAPSRHERFMQAYDERMAPIHEQAQSVQLDRSRLLLDKAQKELAEWEALAPNRHLEATLGSLEAYRRASEAEWQAEIDRATRDLRGAAQTNAIIAANLKLTNEIDALKAWPEFQQQMGLPAFVTPDQYWESQMSAQEAQQQAYLRSIPTHSYSHTVWDPVQQQVEAMNAGSRAYEAETARMRVMPPPAASGTSRPATDEEAKAASAAFKALAVLEDPEQDPDPAALGYEVLAYMRQAGPLAADIARAYYSHFARTWKDDHDAWPQWRGAPWAEMWRVAGFGPPVIHEPGEDASGTAGGAPFGGSRPGGPP